MTEATSDVGRGSGRQAQAAPGGVGQGAPLSILLVEDSEADARLLLERIREGGYEPGCVRVDRLDDLRAALRSQAYDLIFTDYRLAGFQGPEVLAAVADEGLDTPVIVVSGTIGEDIAVRTIQAGASDYLLKGQLIRLVPAVERALREVALARRQEAAERALETRAHQQEVVAGLGQRALVQEELGVLIEEAAALVARTLAVPLAKVVELLPSGELVLRAGVGWRDGLVGTVITAESPDTQVGYTLTSNAPVVVEDLGSEARFRGSPLLEEHGVVSGMSAAIGGGEAPFGVLGAHATAPRVFTEDDVHFLQAIANVLASAIARKRAEDRRIELEEDLRQAQKMEAVGQLAAGVAHDFNNLLTAVHGYAEMLAATFDAGDARAGDVHEITRAVDRATALTRQLLALSRREPGRAALVDVNEVVEGVESLLRRTLGEHVALEVRPGPSLPPVLADPGELEQIVLNLAVNARDAMPAGGPLTIATGVLDVGAAPASMLPPGCYVQMAVSDTGAGMPRHVRERAFEPFFTTKERGRGTGLGLATVWGIVSRAGGHVDIDSEEGKGTIVTVTLPARLGELASSLYREPGGAASDGAGETAMVVEDDASVRALACRILAEHGYRVLEADDAVAALELARRHDGPLHLLLTDVVLPGTPGPELARQVAALRPGIRVLAMSGYAGEGIAPGARLDDGVPLLAKPFTRVELLDAVRQALDGGRE